jgi:succinate dehydrogenase / fumarate reductase cytochrome b subunit
MERIAFTKEHMLNDVDPDLSKIDVLRRHSVGMKAWLVHRISGVGLLIYLLAHIATMGTGMFLGDEAFKNIFQALLHTPILIFFDILILAGIIIHALNGIRIVLLDLGYFITKQKQFFTVIVFLSVGIFIWLFIKAFL